MTLNRIAFTPYLAPNHPTKGGLLPEGVAHYALPGRGVATKEAIIAWGVANQIKVSFLIPGETE